MPENLLDVLVDNNRPVYKDRHARTSSWPGALCSTKSRIHLRRLVFSPSAFSLQSDGGPYKYVQMDYFWIARHPGAMPVQSPGGQAVQRFGLILAAKDWAIIFPFRTTKVSVANSYELSAVSAVQRM